VHHSRHQPGQHAWLLIATGRDNTVYSLKQRIAARSRIGSSWQRLVSAGRALADEMSLDCYRIDEGARACFVPVPRRISRTPPCWEVLSALASLIEELPSAAPCARSSNVTFFQPWRTASPIYPTFQASPPSYRPTRAKLIPI
jgi:hypothetical protein